MIVCRVRANYLDTSKIGLDSILVNSSKEDDKTYDIMTYEKRFYHLTSVKLVTSRNQLSTPVIIK